MPSPSPTVCLTLHLAPTHPFPQKFGLESASELSFRLGVVMLLDFTYLFVASTILGMAFGLVTAYCLRAFHFHHVAQAGRAGLPSVGSWGCFSWRLRAPQLLRLLVDQLPLADACLQPPHLPTQPASHAPASRRRWPSSA